MKRHIRIDFHPHEIREVRHPLNGAYNIEHLSGEISFSAQGEEVIGRMAVNGPLNSLAFTPVKGEKYLPDCYMKGSTQFRMITQGILQVYCQARLNQDAYLWVLED